MSETPIDPFQWAQLHDKPIAETRDFKIEDEVQVEAAIADAREMAKSLVDDPFPENTQPLDKVPLEYHNWTHSDGVRQPNEELLRLWQRNHPQLGITDKDIIMAAPDSWFHDVVQNYKYDPSSGLYLRVPDPNNERSSLEVYHQWLLRHQGVFKRGDLIVAHRVLSGTKTRFSPEGIPSQPGAGEIGTDFHGKLFINPIRARTLSISDLAGSMGYHGSEHYREGGRRFFREKQFLMSDWLYPQIQYEQRSALAEAGRKWIKLQLLFAVDRPAALVGETMDLGHGPQEDLFRLFGKFNESIEMAKRYDDWAQNLASDEEILAYLKGEYEPL